MMLAPPLPIVFAIDTDEPLSRLGRYSGMARCDAATATAFGYKPDAVLPRGLPQPFGSGDTRTVTCKYRSLPIVDSDFIGLVDLRTAMQPLLDLGVSDARHPCDLQEIKALPGYKPAFDELLRRLGECLEISGAVKPLELNMKSPGLPTVTVNDSTGSRVGLHVDSWDRGKASNRALARNRVNMNFGRGPRHFLLVNSSLYACAQRSGVEFDSYDRVSRLVQDMLQGMPDLEILRMQVDPGEAYIAPTDNIIHDATTLEMEQSDISLSILGKLAFRADTVVKAWVPPTGAAKASTGATLERVHEGPARSDGAADSGCQNRSPP